MKRLLIVVVLALLVSFLAACSPEAEPVADVTAAPVEDVAETTAPTATALPTETAIPPTNTPEPTNTPAPTETPAPTATAEMVAEACVSCHVDKDQLIDTAAPVEEEKEPSESSGVG